MTTTDLSDFGYREIKMVTELLNAWVSKGLPKDFNTEKVHPMMNQNSGNVFLTNEDYQVAMMNGEKLESFYSCPNCGCEGFKEDLEEDYKNNNANDCCMEYLKEIE